ncbi:ATPases of the AAA+ class ['Chrysanthemum coronarium' phytoplasma]|uniref:ATPases of the AAA+ class n=1 Tax='Chrysanthemum coronarium' phytoplasma TaxID=1520703 RepID=A0ABQ0J301_9MOLU|nr:ATPases of the AAA+ class ['Chrysanthemum coronarium' phytoplasma]
MNVKRFFVDLTQIREHHKGQSESVTAFKEELTSEKNNPTKPIFLIAIEKTEKLFFT